MKALLLTFILSQGADMTTTVMGLHRGCVEANPIYHKRSLAEMVAIKSASTMTISFVAWGTRKKHPKTAKAILIGGIGAGAGATIWNLHVIGGC